MAALIKVCTQCGTEYERDADYCNVCRRSSLVAVEISTPEETKAPIRSDRFALTVIGITWLLGLGYLLAEMRPRNAIDLFTGYSFLVVVTFVVSMVMKNLRVFALFSGFGLLSVLLYAAVRFT